MKFLKEDGTIEEGIQLSDAEVERLERLEAVLHASACGGRYQALYERGLRECRKIATQVVANGMTLEAALEDRYLPKPEEEHPSPMPTGVEA